MWGIWDKKKVKDLLLIGNNFSNYSIPAWLLTLEAILKLQFYYYNTWILYIFKTFFSKSQAHLLYLIWVLFKSFLYPTQRLFSPSFFHFNSIYKVLWLITRFVLDCFSKFFLFTSLLSFFSSSKSVLLLLLFQNLIIVSSSLFVLAWLLSMVLGLSLFTLGWCNKLWIELTSSFLFLKV